MIKFFFLKEDGKSNKARWNCPKKGGGSTSERSARIRRLRKE